ncbi:dTDP-4-dehydrorhamnose 3,5-epimerase [Myroides phaeus]|uniref:dTDP-4-dehydrorhamnose 3,5-epimerase n=1 Tax=Myroides phaeus TaxID=702745 RepID=UPI0013032F7D|nr:dTDP-4-dehydrorhamnose 3,5-epimerase [Myroides phaeus]
MKVVETELKGCFLIEPAVFKDERGYFFESFNQEKFNQATGLSVQFVQDNQSFSSKNVLRGLHYQRGEYQQAKLVHVIQGTILDVVVDLRPNSPTFRQSFKTKLTSENHQQLFVPRGFAHGFVVLSETAIFTYKCDNYYKKEAEGGIIYNDTDLAIDWEVQSEQLILSEKDIELPTLKESLPICEY